MGFQLVARSGPTAGNIYALDQEQLDIGRDLSCDIVINDPEVSRRHARLLLQGLNYVIEDLGSTNGCMVNGQRLMGPHILYPGEIITLGESISLVFESDQPMEEMDETVVSGAGVDIDATVRASISAQPQDPYAEPLKSQDPFSAEPGIPDPYMADPQVPDPYASLPKQPDPYAMQPEAVAFADQVSPQAFPGVVEEKKKFPITVVLGVILLLLVCMCVVAGYIIDSNDMYCNQVSFIFDDILGMCP